MYEQEMKTENTRAGDIVWPDNKYTLMNAIFIDNACSPSLIHGPVQDFPRLCSRQRGEDQQGTSKAQAAVAGCLCIVSIMYLVDRCWLGR